MKLGDAFLSLATLVWLTVSVGPVWVGVALVFVAFVLNAVQYVWVRRKAKP